MEAHEPVVNDLQEGVEQAKEKLEELAPLLETAHLLDAAAGADPLAGQAESGALPRLR